MSHLSPAPLEPMEHVAAWPRDHRHTSHSTALEASIWSSSPERLSVSHNLRLWTVRNLLSVALEGTVSSCNFYRSVFADLLRMRVMEDNLDNFKNFFHGLRNEHSHNLLHGSRLDAILGNQVHHLSLNLRHWETYDLVDDSICFAPLGEHLHHLDDCFHNLTRTGTFPVRFTAFQCEVSVGIRIIVSPTTWNQIVSIKNPRGSQWSAPLLERQGMDSRGWLMVKSMSSHTLLQRASSTLCN